MPLIGITGHRGFDDETAKVVTTALRAAVSSYPAAELTGVSCLADGTDALFAEAVLEHGGRLEAVIPAAQYREHLPKSHHATYDRLINAAVTCHPLAYDESTSEAHMAASELMLSLIDRLIAVWDGLPARGYGGTADVVARAQTMGLPVDVIWPEGAHRG